MQRIFLLSQAISKDTAVIADKDQVHHMKNVLHFAPGDELAIFDEQGNVYQSVIEKVSVAVVTAKIKGRQKAAAVQDGTGLTIACAIPKKSNMDDIVDKLTQLGTARIIPLATERVIVKMDRHKAALRSARWKKIALSAAEQSRRNTLVLLDPVTQVREVISSSDKFDLKLIPALFDERRPLKEILEEHKPRNILVLIGPEGDFTPEEVSLAKTKGFIPVTLGENVLRVETAAVAVASFIRMYYEKNR